MGDIRQPDTSSNAFWNDKGNLIDQVAIPEDGNSTDGPFVVWRAEDGTSHMTCVPIGVARHALALMIYDDFMQGGSGVEESTMPPEPTRD